LNYVKNEGDACELCKRAAAGDYADISTLEENVCPYCEKHKLDLNEDMCEYCKLKKEKSEIAEF